MEYLPQNFSSSIRLFIPYTISPDKIATDLDAKKYLILPDSDSTRDLSKASKTGVDLINFEKNIDPISIPNLFTPVYASDKKTIVNYKYNVGIYEEDFEYSDKYANRGGIVQYINYLKQKGIRLDTDLNIGVNQDFQKITFEDFNNNTTYVKDFPFNKITKEQIIKLQRYHGLVNGRNSKGQLLVPEDGWVGSQTSQMEYPIPRGTYFYDKKLLEYELFKLETQFKAAKNKIRYKIGGPINNPKQYDNTKSPEWLALTEEYNKVKTYVEETVKSFPVPPQSNNIWFPIVWGNRRFVAKITDQRNNYTNFQKTGRVGNGGINLPPYENWELYDPSKHPLQIELLEKESAELKLNLPQWLNTSLFIEIGKSVAAINLLTAEQQTQRNKINTGIKIVGKVNNNIKQKK